ncbi:MAG: hypothetical protein IT353_15340 [Gemmatimonadaceae bacterium]|nr:hypothetical protein [Gemmatimonadaceae bacterium]
MTEWFIPWEARGGSGPVHDNFLWRSERLYVMDNHRLALWCWWQHLHESEHWTFVHIDRHFDAQWMPINPWLTNVLPEHRQDLATFRAAKCDVDGNEQYLYRWDTLVSPLWNLHSNQLEQLYFACVDFEDADPRLPRSTNVDESQLISFLESISESDEQASNYIVDLDLDYFTRRSSTKGYEQRFSNEFVAAVGNALLRGLSLNRFKVVTVALSPSTTGGWTLAERLLGTTFRDNADIQELLAAAP